MSLPFLLKYFENGPYLYIYTARQGSGMTRVRYKVLVGQESGIYTVLVGQGFNYIYDHSRTIFV